MAFTISSATGIDYSGSGTQNDPFSIYLSTLENLNAYISFYATNDGICYLNLSGYQPSSNGNIEVSVSGIGLFTNSTENWELNLPVNVTSGGTVAIQIPTTQALPSSFSGYVYYDDGSGPPPAVPYSLYVINQPALTTSGQLLSPQPSIGIQDQYGNVLTNFDTDVQVSLVVLSGSATLTGTTTVSTTSGVATFTDLVITGNGLFYLQFDSTILALNSVNSNQLFFQPDPGNPNPPIPVKPKRSYIPGSVPAYTDLEINEFAINVADRKGYMRDSNDIVHLLFDGYASGGGGSGGTVYSVGVSSTDLDVSNSPITTSGFIGLDLKTQSLTAATYGDASNVAEVTVNDKGIVTGIKNVAISYPVNSITAGTDISLTGTAPDYTINNTAPDQIVSITSGTGISVTGTYPNFTVDSTITQYTDADARLALSAGTGISYDNSTGIITNSEPDQVVSLTGGTDIGVTGTYPNFTIDYTGTGGGTGTVTSVGITSTAAALTITNSPITTSGDIGVNFAGKGSEYVTGDGSLKTFPTTIDQALNLITEVYNSTGSTLTKGTVVYINGGQGNLPTITKAQANSDANSAQTYGVVQTDITNNNNGYVVVIGRLTDIDTQAYASGTQLYLSPTTAGAWTSTKPAAPNHLVYVGIVVRSHPTQGVVEIKIQNGYELDEIHDVSITSVASDNILRYNSTTKLWENVAGTTSSISEGTNLYYTDARARLSLSAGTGISYNNTTGMITNSSPDQTVVLTAGTGISTTGTYPNFTITNSSPDQTVVLTAGTGISTSGTYPNFTITNSAPDQTVKLTAGTGISVTGTYPSFTITNSSPSSGGTVTSVGLSAPTGMKVTNSPITSSGTIALSMDTGYALPTSASQTNWDTAYTNRITSLTTTGSSGSATLVSNTLNIPTYTLAGLGGQASSTNLTSLSGLTYVSASFVKMTASGTFSLDTSTYLTANQTITLSGDVTGSGSTSITTTLATVGATKGGTGQTTYTLGDTLYSSASNTLAKLSGNTTTTRKFLRQTGTGTVSAAPAWDTVTKTDVGLSNVENTALSTWAGSSSITTIGTLTALKVGTLTYPSTDGTSGQVLSTNGAGTISWSTVGGTSAAGSTGDIQYNDGSGGFTASSYFSYGSSAYDQLAVYSNNAAFGVLGVFGASGQTYPLLEFRDYLGTTVYSYFDATGNLYLNAQTDIRFADADSSNYVAMQSPATIATNYTLTLPTTAGTNNYVLKTDGSGNLSWTNAVTNLLNGGAGQIPYNTASGTTAFLAAGTSGQVLRSNATSAPSWEAQGLFSSGRLTLESGVAISTTDQTSKTTIYYTPYNGDKISLYDGTNWATYTFTERSLALGTLTSAKNYDVFLYNNSGTLTLEALAWSTDTARATALVLTNGVYLKSGQTTRRYLGTFRTTSTTTTEDSNANRFVWNYNNRVNRMLLKQYVASSWTYATANTYRYLGNNSANSVAFVNGVQEDNIFIVAAAGSSGSGIQRQLAIGFDSEWSSTLAGNSTSQYEATAVQAEVSNESYQAFANRIAGLGYHVAYALELQNSTTTVSYFGGVEAGISGTWRC